MLHRLPKPKVDPERKRAYELREAYVRPVRIAAHTSDSTALASFHADLPFVNSFVTFCENVDMTPIVNGPAG